MSLKNAYEKKLQAQLDEWNAEIEKLKAKAHKANADAQIEYHKKLEEIKDKREAAKAKLADTERGG